LKITGQTPQERPVFAFGVRAKSSPEGQDRGNCEDSGLCAALCFANDTAVSTFDVTGRSIPYYLQAGVLILP